MVKIEKSKRLLFLIFGMLLILLSIILLINDYLYWNSESKKENIEIDNFINSTSIVEKVVDETEKNVVLSNNEIKEEIIVEKKIPKIEYVAILEIPSINLKRGLVDYNSKYNDVKYNVQTIKKSTMPDVINGNLILASHNGTSKVSFFRNLSKLKDESLIYVYYNGYKYIYEYSHSYDVDKTGKIEIIRDVNKSTITLITCKTNDKKKQVVYIGYLIDKVKY
ncbi:MAG: sortase [Firmicutes bacterium]|nr:sortase [Bacillota bacterium]